jgi:hypothetical protein
MHLHISTSSPKIVAFVSCYDPVEKRPISVSTVDQVTANAHAIVTLVLRQDAWNSLLGNTWYVQDIRQKFVAGTKANPCCWDFIYRLGAVGTHKRCNCLDLEFSSYRSWPAGMLIISKLSLLCAKPSCHLEHYDLRLLRRTLACHPKRFASGFA